MNYKIEGDSLPVLILNMNKGDTIYSEPGGKAWYIGNFNIDTNMGGMKQMFGRMISGEQTFRSEYTALEDNCSIAFASSFPGSIIPYKVGENNLIAQKDAFLCMTKNVKMSVHNTGIKKGLFGGEGFFLQKFSGAGVVFLEVDGYCFEYDLKAGEKIVADTGAVAAFESTVRMDIERIKGAKNVLFGGEGLFSTTLEGPGKVYLQSMSIPSLAGILSPHIATFNNNN